MMGLNFVGVVLTEWLLIVAEITGDWQYYAWAFLIVVLWSEAVHKRDAALYPSRGVRILYFGMFYALFLVMNKSYIYMQEFGFPLAE
ncbi:MAG: hypothetical protein OEZ02_15125 [Anaerolineae bacterium]|nr:hypothetical protein [Anaerolineae bacterium]